MPPGYREFEFDLPQALLVNIIQAFSSMEYAALTPEDVEVIPETQGVYQLFHQNILVYIGKTDAQAGLKERLRRHARTIQHRKNLDASQVTFKAVRIFVFTAIDLETQLIQHYRSSNPAVWNFSGFGSNDPGRERDTTNARPEGFDAQFPVDLDRRISLNIQPSANAFDVLVALRKALPYTLRFEAVARGSRQGHTDLNATSITLPPEPFTTRDLLIYLIRSLPPGMARNPAAG